MQNPLQIISCLLITALGLYANEPWRTFTDKQGRTIEARVVSVQIDDDQVTLKLRKSNNNANVPFSNLSDSDLEFIKTWKPTEADEDTEDEKVSNRLYPRTKKEIKSEISEIKKRTPPTGIDRVQQRTVNELNIYRYLSGVPHDVVADPDMTKKATDAATACKKNGGLSHDLGQSTDICNLSHGSSMFDSVRQYIDDFGDNNREKRGHRRWCLNPPLGKTGFGEDGDFSAMVALDTSGRDNMKDSWAYPGKGYFPKEYLHGNSWSLYLTEKAPEAKDLKVEVFELSKSPDKPFSMTEEIPGKALPVTYVKTYINAINFEPQPEPITNRGIFWVRIKGGGVSESYLVEIF